MSYPRKRKHSFSTPSTSQQPSYYPNLFIQAHEADIVRGPQARNAAASLEVRGSDGIGSGLIQLFGDEKGKSQFIGEDEDEDTREAGRSGSGIWVDRYDARLLLDREQFEKLQQFREHSQDISDRASSPGGWSELPSDTEDTFFFSREETEDYHREKRRRLLEQSREARLKARIEEDGKNDVKADQDGWGGSDEEPEEAQKEIMRRTAKHIVTSPNPAQLEMRILANHGGDKRFAFLRGRWRRAWQVIRGKAHIEHEHEQKQKSNLIGALGDYGDSSGEEDGDTEADPKTLQELKTGSVASVVVASATSEDQLGDPKADDEIAVREARRKRAKEWLAKRRAA
ncbi:hypothetical protein E1B28_003151 [Marasmius oreades]|uniref:Uncharacterized protein n=1 Tax=Marasmius oreades TaxID=181124 RepID=A0A9P7RLY5_9AGAR|nr:uncharacterized protein E1B28_003151 [Marasmius oreades]KAG7085600.1 hypothetical protein E1B28_003151 [Marasmius oreades]